MYLRDLSLVIDEFNNLGRLNKLSACTFSALSTKTSTDLALMLVTMQIRKRLSDASKKDIVLAVKYMLPKSSWKHIPVLFEIVGAYDTVAISSSHMKVFDDVAERVGINAAVVVIAVMLARNFKEDIYDKQASGSISSMLKTIFMTSVPEEHLRLFRIQKIDVFTKWDMAGKVLGAISQGNLKY